MYETKYKLILKEYKLCKIIHTYLVKSRDSSEEKIQFATAAQSTICVRIILSTSTAIIYNEKTATRVNHTYMESHPCYKTKIESLKFIFSGYGTDQFDLWVLSFILLSAWLRYLL